MIWGMDYSPDGSMWYTDEAYDTIWRFSILDEEYSRIAYSDTDTFPQKIEVDGSSLIINDFTGARISFIEQITQKGASSQFMSIPSPLEESFASDFALDGDHIWYTNWVFGGQGVLVSFNHKEYETKSVENPSFDEYIKAVDLPEKTQTPNGLTVDSNGFVWIADTSSSSLYQFDKQTESFTEYMTLPPPVSSYGNATGLVLSPVSRPYWLEAYGDLVIFNEQTGNRIGVLNPTESRLVEYAIPSANPNWADCGIALNCGLAQVFGFDISDQKVWFTEWVENNIGVLDLSLDLPIDIKFDPDKNYQRSGNVCISGRNHGIIRGIDCNTWNHSNELQPMEDTITGTPADSFPDAQRQQFCSTGGPQSGRYVTEYEIPTACTQPLAIKVDPQGTVWFAQTNTGNIANFEPSTGTFTEFENEAWPESGRSMIWGMDYSPDGSMWYTDEAYDTIWRFSILDEEYSRIAYSDTDTFPQKIEVDGSSLIINDFTGARISFIEQITQKGASSQFMSIPSPLEESFASDFALDGDHIWYTNWVFGGQGVLVSFNHKEYETKSVENPSFDEYIKAVDLPEKTQTPNGLTVDSNGFVWIADTSSSSLYQFDKQTESFTEYMTLPPPVSSYGNATGLVLSPVSRPYWLEAYGDLVIFNEQTGNRIGVLNPTESSIIPSWGTLWEIFTLSAVSPIADMVAVIMTVSFGNFYLLRVKFYVNSNNKDLVRDPKLQCCSPPIQ